MAARAPHFRGKARAVLAVFSLLGLRERHLKVIARLRRPVPFDAELDLHSWLQRLAFVTGGYEADTVRFLCELQNRAGREGFLLDVGANIGLIAIPCAKSLRRGAGQPAVVAIEAVPDNVAVLRRNMERNAMGELVRLIPTAVGAVAGTVEIQVEGDLRAGEGTGTANILPDGSTYECVRQSIEVRTIDDLANEGLIAPGCVVMKIDTDGYDLKVLQGAASFLERERPVIFGEFAAHCLGWHGQSLADVVEFAREHRYEVWRRGGGWTFRRPRPDDPPFVQDLLLVPIEQVVRFAELVEADS